MAEPMAPEDVSDEVQDLLGTPPPWIIRRGVTTAVVAVSLLVLAAWMVRIPESVEASAILQTDHVPVRVRIPQSTPLFAVFVREGDTVRAGSWLAVAETDANPIHVLRLQNILMPMQTMSGVEAEQVILPAQLDLGPLDPLYRNFLQTFKEFSAVLNAGYDQGASTSFQGQIALVRSSVRVLEEKLRKGQSALASARKKVMDGQLLIRQKKLTYEAYASLLSGMKEVEGQVQDIELDLQREQQEMQRLQRWQQAIRQQAVNSNYERLLELRRDLRQLLEAMQQWEDVHILKAPIDGRVHLESKLIPGRLYRNNFRDVFTIVPFNAPGEQITALLHLQGGRAGKVMPGQSVFIHVEGYPVTEFGWLKGRVQDRPYYSGEADRKLTVDVVLDTEMITTTGFRIPFDFAMRGQAEIIIENDRFLYQLLSGLK